MWNERIQRNSHDLTYRKRSSRKTNNVLKDTMNYRKKKFPTYTGSSNEKVSFMNLWNDDLAEIMKSKDNPKFISKELHHILQEDLK